MCVFVQGKETTEEEEEVAVGMDKGFMDEFFEQVCFRPDVCVSVSHSYCHSPIRTLKTCHPKLRHTSWYHVSPNTKSNCVVFFRAL